MNSATPALLLNTELTWAGYTIAVCDAAYSWIKLNA